MRARRRPTGAEPSRGLLALRRSVSRRAARARTADAHDDGHDHAGEGRDHSGKHGHAAGPHDRTVTDWGGGAYHTEFLVDRDKQQATVSPHGPDEKTLAPIAAESIRPTIVEQAIDVELAASPQEGDPEGKALRFVGTDPGLGVVREYEGTISGLIDGTPYTGDFEEDAHARGGRPRPQRRVIRTMIRLRPSP